MSTLNAQRDAIGAAPALPDDVAARVLRNDWVNDDYKHMVLHASGAACHAQPGQFFNLLCPVEGKAMPFFRRPMSTYRADPHTEEVEFLYKVAGTGTATLSHLQAGDTVNILGPLGKGFRLQQGWQHVLIVARGVGLATLAPLAEAAHAQSITMTVVLSARSPQALLTLSQQRFECLGASVITAFDNDGTSHPDALETVLRTQIAVQRPDAFFTCGSMRLTALLKRLSLEYAIAGQVATEEQMVCGLGMCQCCTKVVEQRRQRVSKRVCVDGPVFDLAEVIV